MNTRIKAIREGCGLTQEEFGKRIGSARNTIANYETGNRKPSNVVITSICREFNINEEWLRTGDGEPKKDMDIEFGEMCADIGVSDPKAKEAIEKYYQLSPEDKKLWWNFMERFMK